MRRVLPVLVALLLLPAVAPSRADGAFEVREVFSPDGTIARVRIPARPATSAVLAAGSRTVVPLEVHGPVGTAFDLVVVGDGYTASQQGAFLRDARAKAADLFAVEPYRTYRGAFNVWAVEVVSPESGVDADPNVGVLRDTALDMEFWCGGTERLLCVDEAKAKAAASAAPDVDHVLAVANSTKYGGAGGSVATASGGNKDSGQVAVHELGHSIGGLADEYDSPYPAGTAPGEAPEPNASVFPEPLMTEQQTKWWRWIGKPTPDGGVIGTVMGGRYNPVLYYRPSNESIMRVLGKPFNLVGREAMVLGFYKTVSPVLSSSRKGTVLRVTTVRPGMQITWRVGDRVVATGRTSFDARGLRGTVTATVVDTTPWVLDRSAKMAATATWHL